MTELYKILFTTFLTVISGVLVLATGQLITKLIIEPLHDQKKLIGEIANSLIMYGNIGTGIENNYVGNLQGIKVGEDEAQKLMIERNQQLVRHEWERTDTAKTHLRQQASELMGKTNAIPFYGLWAFLPRRPKQESILKASTLLIGISNSSNHKALFTLGVARSRTWFRRFNLLHRYLRKLVRTMKLPEVIKAEKAEAALDQASDLIQLTTQPVLLAAGFHTHHRQWRRKRNGR